MDTKRLVAGTIVGGVILHAVGYLMFNVAFAAFYSANAGSATGVDRVPQLLWPLVLANLSYAALITLAIGNRAGSSTIRAGVTIGAVVGFLLWFTADFVFYGSTNIANLTRTVVDPLLEVVHGGVGGGVIAVVLAKIPASGHWATSYTVDSRTQITATVPAGAKTGKIAVTTPGGTASKGTFTEIWTLNHCEVA